jgi:hypothetical protein
MKTQQYVVNVCGGEDEPLVIPVIDFSPEEKKENKSAIRDTTDEPLTIPNYRDCVHNFAMSKLEDKTHIVVPCVMLVEGVHAGSNGALFYPANELKKSCHLWNGRPVVAYHPSMFADSFAGHPEIFNLQKVGVIFNAKFEGKAIKAECWLDPERLKKVDDRILKAVENGKMMELSTGVFTENEDTAGTFNGKKYLAIARNYQPDHLAILPTQKGACSIADGCGLCRNLGQNEEALLVPKIW